MFSEQSREQSIPSSTQPTALPLFAVQLQNILPIEIVTKRIDDIVDLETYPPTMQLNIAEPTINTEKLQAKVVMEVSIEFSNEVHIAEISFKLLGSFTYVPSYDINKVREFLQQGSLSVMLPSARELLLSLCTRLQLPLLVLPLIQLAPPALENEEVNNLQ